MNKKIIILIAIAVLLVIAVTVSRSTSMGTSLVWELSDQGKWLLPLVAVSALIDSINPCAFSVLFLTIAFLFSIESLRKKVFKVGGAYILGIAAVYFLIGLGLLQVLHLFNTPHFMAKVGAVLIMVLGAIGLIKEFFPQFPIKIHIPALAHRRIAILIEKGSIPAAFILGVLVGLCEFPCTGGPYLMVVGLLHDTSTYLKGVLYLLFYNLIFILPLVIILLLASDKNVLDKVQQWQQKEKRAARILIGFAMLALGVIIFFF